MITYKTSIICKNGHLIDCNAEPQDVRSNKFCTICGSENISVCQECQTPIRGRVASFIIDTAPYTYVPAYCHECGKPYPWTVTALSTAAEIIEEDDSLTADEIQKLISVLPDVISETPKSNIAAIRIKKAFLKISKFTAEALKTFIIDFGCEFIKSQLGL